MDLHVGYLEFLNHNDILFFSGTSPNQNFVKNPDVQDMGLSSSSVDGGEGRSQPAAAAASDGRAAWKGAELAALLTAAIVVATLNTNWSL